MLYSHVYVKGRNGEGMKGLIEAIKGYERLWGGGGGGFFSEIEGWRDLKYHRIIL